jgi:hypothetical protein
MPLLAGQGVGLIRGIDPTAAIVGSIMADGGRIIGDLAGRSATAPGIETIRTRHFSISR